MGNREWGEWFENQADYQDAKSAKELRSLLSVPRNHSPYGGLPLALNPSPVVVSI